MVEILLLFCIMCNFFRERLAEWLGTGSGTFILNTASNAINDECQKEMLIIFIILTVISFIINKKVPYKQYETITEYPCSMAFRRFIFGLLLLFMLFNLYSINWSFVNENRGVGQFELNNRQTVLEGIMSVFYMPLLMYVYIVGIFDKRFTYNILIIALVIYVVNGLSSGGRSNVVFMILYLVIPLYYRQILSKKKVIYILVVGLALFTMSASERWEATSGNFITRNLDKLIQVNGNSWFLPMVKKTMAMGIELSPTVFVMHFVSIFVPTFIWIMLGRISYNRSTFVFNDLYNPNPNSGLGFMMLADFYWCFGYVGYALYILAFVSALLYFKKHILSNNPVFIISSITVIIRFCNQRADFGAFLKPSIYCLIFIWLLEWMRKRGLS